MSVNVCATIGNNTGKGTCDVRMKRPKYMLLSDYEFSEEELADSDSLKAALIRQMLKANRESGKVYLSPKLRVVNDNTGDPNVQTLADGYEEVLNEAQPKYSYQFTAGVCQHQSFANFSGWAGRNYRIDQDNVFWYKTKSGGGGKGFQTPSFYVDPPRDGNSSGIATGTARVTFEIDDFKSNIGAVKLDFDVADLVNLVDVDLEDREDDYDSPSSNTNVFYIGGKIKCQGADIYDTLKASLANVNRWTVENVTQGTTGTFSAVSTSDSLKAWILTVAASFWAAADSGDKIRITGVDPATLKAAGITGIELGAIVFTKG